MKKAALDCRFEDISKPGATVAEPIHGSFVSSKTETCIYNCICDGKGGRPLLWSDQLNLDGARVHHLVSEVQFEGRFEQLRSVRTSQSCELSRCWQYWQSYGQREPHGFVTSSHCDRLNNRKKGGNRVQKGAAAAVCAAFARRLRSKRPGAGGRRWQNCSQHHIWSKLEIP
jgi:hypothetical protein